jgi:hypothetical protein
MGKTAPLAIFTDDVSDSDEGQSNRAYAEFVYGCKNASCLVLVKSHEDLAIKLRQFDQIDRLVLLLHGVIGSIAIKTTGNGHEFMGIEKFVPLLQGAKTVVKEGIYFEGCNVAESPGKMLLLMDALRAPKATGYSVYHFWGPAQLVTVRKGDSAAALAAKLETKKAYLLPNQPSAEELVKRPGQKIVWGEWFSHDIGDIRFPEMETERRIRLPRNRLVSKTYTAEQSKTAGLEIARSFDMLLVTVTLGSTAGAK